MTTVSSDSVGASAVLPVVRCRLAAAGPGASARQNVQGEQRWSGECKLLVVTLSRFHPHHGTSFGGSAYSMVLPGHRQMPLWGMSRVHTSAVCHVVSPGQERRLQQLLAKLPAPPSPHTSLTFPPHLAPPPWPPSVLPLSAPPAAAARRCCQTPWRCGL